MLTITAEMTVEIDPRANLWKMKFLLDMRKMKLLHPMREDCMIRPNDIANN